MPVSQSVVRSAVCAEPLLTRAPPARLPPLHTSAQGSRFFFLFFKNAIRSGSQIPSAFAFEWVICVDFAGRALKWFDWNLMMNTHDWVLFTISLVHSKFQLRNALVLCELGTHALTHAHAYILWMDCVFSKCEYIGDSYNSVSLDWFLPSTALICYRYDYRYLRLISSNSEIMLIWFMSYCIGGKRKSDLLFKYTADSLLNMLLKTEHSNEFVSCSGSLSNS